MAKAKKLAEGLKRIGDKVVKKRMTAKERNEMSKPFKKMLSDAQKSKKGMSKKEFDARVKKGMDKDARIAKVKAENMAAATGPIKPKKKAGGGMMKSKGMRAGGSVQKMKGGGRVKRLATGVARKAYQAKTAPVQAAAKVVEKIAPGSKVDKALKKVARPFKGGGMVKSKGMKAGGAMKSKGMKNGGVMKSKGMRAGGVVKSKGMSKGGKRQATGAAKRGFGKAYMKGKR